MASFAELHGNELDAAAGDEFNCINTKTEMQKSSLFLYFRLIPFR